MSKNSAVEYQVSNLVIEDYKHKQPIILYNF